MKENLLEIGKRCANLPDKDTRSPNEILGYDSEGLPNQETLYGTRYISHPCDPVKRSRCHCRIDQQGYQTTSFSIVPFDSEQAEIATSAWRHYGKSNHAAGLNFGDCFAYEDPPEPLSFYLLT